MAIKDIINSNRKKSVTTLKLLVFGVRSCITYAKHQMETNTPNTIFLGICEMLQFTGLSTYMRRIIIEDCKRVAKEQGLFLNWGNYWILTDHTKGRNATNWYSNRVVVLKKVLSEYKQRLKEIQE